MYTELKTDDVRCASEAAQRQIESGVPAMLVFGRDGDFYTLAINTGGDEPIDATPS